MHLFYYLLRHRLIEICFVLGTLICKVLEEDKINNNGSVGQKAPLWVKDEDVTMCMLCTLKFGLIYRKHHCRGCGRVS